MMIDDQHSGDTDQAERMRKVAGRIANKGSLRTIAKAADVHYSHISLILAGKRSPSLRVARRMAAYFDVTLEEFAGYLDSLAAPDSQPDGPNYPGGRGIRSRTTKPRKDLR